MNKSDEKKLADHVSFCKDFAKFPLFCKSHLKIQTKEHGLQPFILNPPQIRYWRAILKAMVDKKPLWFVILKARQEGFSTFTEAVIYWMTSFSKDFKSSIIAHESTPASNLYQMFKVYYEFMPEFLKPGVKSPGNEKVLRFNTRSSVHVFTAGSPEATSSGTYQAVHVSELSKWKDPDTAMLSLKQTMPRGAFFVVESTAKGVGNHFHRLWQTAERGENEFIPLFFSWFEMPEYEIPLEDSETIEPDEEEKYYVNRFNLSDAKLKWMRWTRINKCDGDWNLFRQEYPSYPEEAFLFSGKSVFSLKTLRDKELMLESDSPIKAIGELVLTQFTDPQNRPRFKVKFESDVNGWLEIYDLPDPNSNWRYRYVTSADVCEGIDKGMSSDKKKSGDTDYNAVSVWDRIEARQVAFFRNKSDGKDLAHQIFAINAWYNCGMSYDSFPFSIIERNKDGLTVILYYRDLCSKYGVPLNRMYHRGAMDKNYEPTTDLIGFRTLEDTKPPLIGEMGWRIRDGEDGIRSLQVIKEAMSYVRDERGRTNAQEGEWDDSVIAMALGYEGARRDHDPYQPAPVKQLQSGWRARMFGNRAGNTNYRGYYSK